MKDKVCPICGTLVPYKMYFGSFSCQNCGWKLDIRNFYVSDDTVRQLLQLSDDEVKLLKEQLGRLEEFMWNSLLGYTLVLSNETVADKVITALEITFGSSLEPNFIKCIAFLVKRFQFVFPQSQKGD